MSRPIIPPAERRRLLEFIHAQSYGKSVGTVTMGQQPERVPGLAPEAESEPLEPRAPRLLAHLPYAPFQEAPAQGEHLERIHAALYGAFGLLRHEPSNPYNPHRSFPSARGLFPVHAWLLRGASAAHYDPLGHRLEPTARSGRSDGPAQVALVGNSDVIPEAYGTLRYALTVLEAGHALYNLALLARALGLPATVRLGFPDAELRERLSLSGSEAWMPLALVDLEPVASGGAALAGTERAARPRAAHPLTWVDRAGWLESAELERWRQAEAPMRSPLPAGGPTLAAPSGLPPLEEVLYARTSGRSSAGLSARVTRVPGDMVHTALHLGLRRPPLDLETTAESPSGLRVFLVSERVGGLDDGVYELSASTGQLASVRKGRFLSVIQQAFSYPPTSTNILSMNAVWLLSVDYPEVLDRWGARGVRLANLELGWVAQGLCCAMA
ncbi:MAG: hypothetical protein ACJ8AT_18405, partial [Hyalangium sp.]|uniref:hypothetical protein n=1 Tax=Hyalangium sp. TaxID=2028555 RepID=UPI003899D42D